MAKDKRLLIAKVVIQHIQRKNGGSVASSDIGVFLQFIVHPRLIALSNNNSGVAGGNSSSGGDQLSFGNSGASSSSGSTPAVVAGVGVGNKSSNNMNKQKVIMTVGGKKLVPVDGKRDRAPRGAGQSRAAELNDDATSTSAANGNADNFTQRIFTMPNSVFPRGIDLDAKSAARPSSATTETGSKISALIVPRDIAVDCVKINKKYKYYDYVCCVDSILTQGPRADEMSVKRAAVVAKTFQRFVVDKRCIDDLPRSISVLMSSSQKQSRLSSSTSSSSIKKAAAASVSASNAALAAKDELEALIKRGAKSVTLLDLAQAKDALDDEDLPFLLGQGAKGQGLTVSERDGRCLLRVGHAGMSAGEITTNINHFATKLKELHPTIYRAVTEFKLISSASEPIRYMATNAA